MKPNSFIQKLREYPVSSHKAWEIGDKKDVLKLDWNESSLDAPDIIKKEMIKFIEEGLLQWYPDSSHKNLLNELAKFVGVPVEHIQYFEGSDRTLDNIVRTFVSPGEEVIIAAPTYDNFRVYVESVGASTEHVFQKDIFSADIMALVHAASDKTKAFYIVSPNNPTGSVYSKKDIQHLLETFPDKLVILDEAYIEFAGASLASLALEYDNIVIVRSLSKAFGLASIRFGYMISALENIQAVNKIRNGKNPTTLTQVAALTALKNKEYMEAYVEEVRTSRDFLCAELKKMGFETRETPANFILLKTDNPKKLCEDLIEQKVFIRNMSHLPGMAQYVRVTVGKLETSQEFCRRLKQLKHNG